MVRYLKGFEVDGFSIDSTQQNESLTLLVEPNPLNLTAASSSEIVLIGEPVHVGDSLTASILVHNQGLNPESVSLVISSDGLEQIQGESILINPGSSRGVRIFFTLLTWFNESRLESVFQ